nr:nicotinate phosphoribosyltransferase [bacterium]
MRNLTLLTDLYQLTMMQGYLRCGKQDEMAVFDVFFRHIDDFSEYAVVAGLEQAVEYIRDIHFGPEELDYIRNLHIFDEDFLEYLKNFRFEGDIDAMPEGTICFPGEPLVRVKAKLPQAQLIETALLNIVNHQTLIATKASRVVYAAQNTAVMEFGLRRAQGPDAGLYGARAAIIGGCDSTSNVLAGQMFDVAVKGTHAHSWVMSFPSELEAFRAYADVFPDGCMLLVDTYDALKSGMPNAIKVFNELRAKGHEPVGIRIDSGDLAYLSKQARRMMDEAGFPNTIVCASGDLDEELIWDLRAQGAAIDIWGVGTKMITSKNNPALGGVYKLSALEENGQLVPKIKISESQWKITNPGVKQVWRLYDADGMATADLVTLEDEVIDESRPLTIFDPVETWKRMTLTDFTARPLLQPVLRKGEVVCDLPPLNEIKKYAKKEMATLWEEYKRLKNPHIFKVDLSDKLYALKQELLSRGG